MFFVGESVCPRASALVELQRSLGCPCKCQNVGTVEDSSLFELLRTFFFLLLRVGQQFTGKPSSLQEQQEKEAKRVRIGQMKAVKTFGAAEWVVVRSV